MRFTSSLNHQQTMSCSTMGGDLPATSRELPDRITKDTRLCLSLSGRRATSAPLPQLPLRRAGASTSSTRRSPRTTCPPRWPASARSGIRGAGVSMPFKEASSRSSTSSRPPPPPSTPSTRSSTPADTPRDVAHLVAYNTDYLAVAGLLAQHGITPAGTPGAAAVLGSGGMAKASLAALRDAGFSDLLVVARIEATGAPARRAVRGARLPALGDVRPDLLLNATPVGMAGGPAADDLPVARAAVEVAAARRRGRGRPRGHPARPARPRARHAAGARDRGRRLAGRRAVRAVHRGPAERRPGPPSG